MTETMTDCAAAVGAFFAGAFAELDGWRDDLAGGDPTVRPADLDARVEGLARPALTDSSPLFVGAGFIAAPGYVRGRDIHFAWWLGPQGGNPLLGSSSSATRLDLATRAYADYVRNFRTLEWDQVPQSTNQTHVTGPYVDHLCTCEYIFTLTMPVRIGEDAPMVGVVGADVAVKRLEQVLLPLLLAADGPMLLLNDVGRIVVSTDPTRPVGDMLAGPGHPLTGYNRAACPGVDLVIASPAHPSQT
ncbi:MAG: hypothetical protein LH475_01155 [Cryobacterium sp.]|uniref:hypothetical protein n=1 Tax=unclassified Cryobacterium TaxID=2649013 RepID=UPI0018CA8C84|nr:MULTISPECIES: hypothetical protein [unclassified Cryobacterium]MCY7403237.1 hypothetical protein [Cryobacterium sp.]MEC5154516.1 hypothetical protein [Cryobacterium sp. CAN_C3]